MGKSIEFCWVIIEVFTFSMLPFPRCECDEKIDRDPFKRSDVCADC